MNGYRRLRILPTVAFVLAALAGPATDARSESSGPQRFAVPRFSAEVPSTQAQKSREPTASPQESTSLPDKKKVAIPPVKKVMGKRLRLALNYARRVSLPPGSQIDIVVRDRAGRTIFSRRAKTSEDLPPYVVELPVPPDKAFPLKVDATVKSPVGHRFSNDVEVSKSESDSPDPITIMLR